MAQAAAQRSTLNGGHPSPEREYGTVADPAHRKAFGQFFTPATLADLMADWIARTSPHSVLEPALGTGVLARAVRNRLPDTQIFAYEKDRRILEFTDVGPAERTTILCTDFMASPYDDKYDAVVMNPPYIRHREMTEYDDARAQVSVKAGHLIPKSANLYVYFTVKAALQLKPGGRAAVLIPSEWMNANFSVTFKQFLNEKNLLREIVLFSGCSNVFEDALTTASILFLERPA